MGPQNCPSLLLNADYRPINLFPLALWNWQDTVTAVLAERVDVVEEYDLEVRSSGSLARGQFTMRLPSVLALKVYQRQDRPAPFTRAGVMLRARGMCAYCTRKLTYRELTFDHVIPQSTGGKSSYMNVVAACSDCNAKKANKPLRNSGLTLMHKPYVPTRQQLNDLALRDLPLAREKLHPTWFAYLGMTADPNDTSVKRFARTEAAFPADMTDAAYWGVELIEGES